MRIFIFQNSERNFTNGVDPIEKRFDVVDESGNIIGVVRGIKDVMLSKGEVQMEIEIVSDSVVQQIKSVVATK